jgi:hypothetical protein
MILKNVLAAVICALTLLAWSSRVGADEYRGNEVLGLDLSRAALSPKLLGPAAQFQPVPVEATAERGNDGAQARVEPKVDPTATMPKARTEARTEARINPRIVHARVPKPRGAARIRLARHHGNPLDAQALDTRIQVWPCKSGGICNWQR